MKAVLLSLLLLVGLSQVFGQTPVGFGVQYNNTIDNCLTQYYKVDATALSAQSYLFFTVIHGDTDTDHGVLFYVAAGFQPTAGNSTWSCNTVNNALGTQCYIHIDCAFKPVVYYITVMISWGSNTPRNVSSAYNFTIVQGAVPVTDLGTVLASGLAPTNRFTQNYTKPSVEAPYAPNWEHFKVTVSPLPIQVNQGADLIINITNIMYNTGGAAVPFEAYSQLNQYNDENSDCTRQACVLNGNYCTFTWGYCSLVGGVYYIAVKRGIDGSSFYNFTVSAYYDIKPVTTLTLNTAKYDQIPDWALEKYYTFTTTAPSDEVTVNVYDVAGGNVTWWASQNYVVRTGSSGVNCQQLISCSTPYGDACRDQYHYCPTPAAGNSYTWYITVRATSRIDGVRNRDFISYVVMASAKARTNTPLSSPQFAVTGNVQGAVYQEDYDYYSFSLPSAIVNETFYIELYIDSTQDEALLSRNYLMDGTTFAGPTLKGSNSRCQDYDWQCRTNQTGATGNQRCYLQIPTCKLIPGTTLYFSVYGIKSQFYGIPISYTLFGGLQTPMQLQDGISYQDQTNQQSYVHYLYRYSATDKTPGDALLIEVTNIKASTTTNVYVNFKGALAGDCPCYKYDYMCTDAQECLFDTYTLFGGAGCQALQTGDIYISVLGVNDTGLPNIGYTITITKYNWAGPVNTLVAGNLVYGYVSDSENVFYWLDTSAISITSPLVEMEVRFVEYIKNGNNDGEMLTLYAMRDNLLTPTCAPYTCTTPRYTDANGYSYCKVVLQPCQFDKSKDWYLVVRGTGGNNKGRSIHYTIRAKPVAVTPMALTNGVPQPGTVHDIGQIDHYSYAVSSTTNKRLYIEMYVDKDFARQVEFKVNFNYLASGSMCYNYTGSCTVINGYTVKCVYHIPNCQLQAGTYYFGVHALNDFYNGPAPYTIAVYEKTEILPIGDATDPNFGPVFTKLQRGEYQVFQFDASQLKQGDLWYFEIDSVERGNLTVVASSGKPAGLCPCYGPIGKNVFNDVVYNVTNYWLFSQSCSASNVYYFYVQPLITDGYWNESHVAFSATIYVNKPTAATTLVMGQANNVSGTTTHYTHRYYVIPQNVAYAQSDIIVHFRNLNTTLPVTTLFGKAGGYTNDLCGVNTNMCTLTSCDLLLKPCQHRLDLGSYYFDVTAFTNDSYNYQLWYDRVDVSAVTVNTNASFNFSSDAMVNNYHVLTPAVSAGSIVRITISGYTFGTPANVRIASGSRFLDSCQCTDAADLYSLTNADLVIDWTACKVGSGPLYVTVQNPSGAVGYWLKYTVIAAPTVQTLAPGTLGTFTATSWLQNAGDFSVYKVTIPAAINNSPVFWDVSMDGASWASGANFIIYESFGTNFGYKSKETTPDVCNGALTCTQTCTSVECCTDSTKATTILFTVYRINAGNQTFTLTATIGSKINAYTSTANVSSAQIGLPSGYSVSHINNIPVGSVAVLTILNTNYTAAPSVYRADSDITPLIPVGTDSTGCFVTGSSEICGGVWTATPNATCTTYYDCANAGYTVTYANADSAANAYSVLWNVYPPLSLTLGVSLTYTVIPALINRKVQFVLDLTNAGFDAGNKFLSVNITNVNGPTTIDAFYNIGGPACTGTSLCTFAAPNCLGTIDGCPSRATKYYFGIVADQPGTYVINTALITKPLITLPISLSSYTNKDPDTYYVYPYNTVVASLDVFYSAMNPSVQANQYGIGDYCQTPTTTTFDGTRNRIYPCPLNQAANKKVYFRSNGFAGQANYTYTINVAPYSPTAMTVGTTYSGSLDQDGIYAFYNFTLPTMKPYDTVTVSFTASCGAIHVLENWNAPAWPDQATPNTGGSGTCYLSSQNAVNSATFSYTWCNWPNVKQERTIYFAVMGADRPYTNQVSYTAVATLTNSAPTVTQLPLRMDYYHNATFGNVVYWFETQTEAVGTQVYLTITVNNGDYPNTIAKVTNEWLEDSSCQSTDQVLYNELSTQAPPSWGDSGNTYCIDDTTGTRKVCTFMLYPAEYRDGRYYIWINSALATKDFHLYAWVQRQGAVNVAQDWSGYGTLGLPKEYQYYSIATLNHNYVTIKLWNVTNGQVSLLLPEYSSGALTSKLYGGETLGSFEASDNNDIYPVTLNQFLVVPLGVCYFCTPNIYVAVRADTITTLGTSNATLGYSISFHFPTEMNIDNDTTVCSSTHFNVNETTYVKNMTWEDIWVVKSWTYTGEQYFYWDTATTTDDLNFVFSAVGPASKNSPARGSDECGYSSANAQVTLDPAGTTANYYQECNYNQYHITVLDSQNARKSNYYLHPVVYQYAVQTYTLGTTLTSTQCGNGIRAYYKVVLTTDNVSYLTTTQTGAITRVDFQYGQVPDSGLWPTALPCHSSVFAINSGSIEFCKVQSGTLYFSILAAGPYTFTLNYVTPPVTVLSLNSLAHGSFATTPMIYSVTINPTPGQQLVVTLGKYYAAQTASVAVMKDSMRPYCNGYYARDTSAGNTVAVTLSVCDTVAATYYIWVTPLTSCSSPNSNNEFTLTATLTAAIPEVTLTSGVTVNGLTSTTYLGTALYTFTPASGNFIAVNFRTTEYTTTTTLTLEYSAGAAIGYQGACAYYPQKTLCTLSTDPAFASTHWCTAEIPACAFTSGKLYGFRVTAADGQQHGFQLTVTAQTFSALTSTATPATVVNQANYYSISTSTIQALGLKVAVTTGQVEVRVWTYNCTYDCNQFERYFRCDANEGECRLEFANAVSHPRSLMYQVKIYGTATYAVSALTGNANSLAAGSLPSNYFCYGTVNYTTWNYKSTSDRDAEAQRLYNRWVGTGKWNCPSQACLKNLKFLACYYFFPQADPNGFLYDTCQTTCWTTTTSCGGNFTWAGFPEWDCYNHFYKPAPYCTGAFPGCDGVPGSGKTYDACGVCGGNGQSCATTSATGGPTSGGQSTTGASGNTTLTTTGLSTTGTTTSGKNTTTTGTTTSKTTTTTTTTTSKSTTSAGPTTTSTTGVNAAITSQPAFIFVMFAALVLLFLQA